MLDRTESHNIRCALNSITFISDESSAGRSAELVLSLCE